MNGPLLNEFISVKLTLPCILATNTQKDSFFYLYQLEMVLEVTKKIVIGVAQEVISSNRLLEDKQMYVEQSIYFNQYQL